MKLRDSIFWYQDIVDPNNYGFVKSIDNSTGQILDDTRFLIDNIMPIFLLIDNIGSEINTITIDSKFPKDSIEEMFLLINSSQFWDETYEGFYDHNSTTNKFAESNMYATLAALEIRRIYDELNLDNTIENRAYEIANLTIDRLLSELWDNTDGGFEYYGKNDWSSEAGSTYKYLQTNALGIITLLEYWIDSGMKNDSTYFRNATFLFNKMESLWDSGFNAYEQFRDSTWSGIPLINATFINLEANAVMMSACLKLFEYTGNITYYDSQYGNVRILSGDSSYPFGTIVRVKNSKFSEFIGIVLDRGGAVGFGKSHLFDLLFATSDEARTNAVSYNTTFEILRYGKSET